MTESSAQQTTTKTRGRKSKSTNEPIIAETPAPVKSSKEAKKLAKSSKTATQGHPKFSDMIAEALNTLNEKSGSSRQAILKYILATYPVDQKTANQYLKVALKNGVKSGQLKQLKGVGASGSFKLAEKQAKPSKPVKVAVVKKETKSTEKPDKKDESKKAPAKKTTNKKTAPKRKAKTVTKEAAKAQLPSSSPKGRKPLAVRGPVVAKKTRGKKSTEPSTPAPSPAETPSQTVVSEQAKDESKKEHKQPGRKGRVSVKKAAEAKSKKSSAATSTRGRKKEAESSTEAAQ